MQDLCATLTDCHPPTVVKSLIKGLKDASQAQIDVVQSLLAPLLKAASEPLHCVRCHKEYFESGNSDFECEVEHDDAIKTGLIEYHGYDKRRIYKYPCCNEEFSMGSSLNENNACYTAPHTTDPDDVDYERNGMLETCELMGCDTKAQSSQPS